MAAEVTVRQATSDDLPAVARVWHGGWADGHLGHVPVELAAHRTRAHFDGLAAARLAHTSVAVSEDRIVGFIVVHDDELEQCYVDRAARGSGVADILIAHGERLVAERFDVAWLAVVEGNARARRFYERSGWRDAGAFDYAAEVEGGSIAVPARRYEKRLKVSA